MLLPMVINTEKDTGVEPDLKKMMRSLGNQVPMRISDIPYTREKHHESDPAVFKRESVGSLANCIVCHITAEKRIYDDDDVKIPK